MIAWTFTRWHVSSPLRLPLHYPVHMLPLLSLNLLFLRGNISPLLTPSIRAHRFIFLVPLLVVGPHRASRVRFTSPVRIPQTARDYLFIHSIRLFGLGISRLQVSSP